MPTVTVHAKDRSYDLELPPAGSAVEAFPPDSEWTPLGVVKELLTATALRRVRFEWSEDLTECRAAWAGRREYLEAQARSDLMRTNKLRVEADAMAAVFDHAMDRARAQASVLPELARPLREGGIAAAIRKRVKHSTDELPLLNAREAIEKRAARLGVDPEVSDRFFDAVYAQILTEHERALARAAEAAAEPADAPAPPAEDDPVETAAAALIESLRKRIGEIERKIKTERSHLEPMRRILEQSERAGRSDIADETRRYLEESTPETEAKVAAFEAHAAVLRAKVERLETDPQSMFLPLGTVVRFTDVPTYENSLSYGDTNKSYPLAGAVGVVTRLNGRGEYPIAVSLRRPFKDGWDQEWDPDYDRFPTFLVDPDKVKVVGPGMLPGGRPCDGFGYVPTHHRLGTKITGDRDDEMIVEADGFFWRFCEVASSGASARSARGRSRASRRTSGSRR